MTPARVPGVLSRAAAAADVPVFAARGDGAGGVDVRLRASKGIAVVDSPRAATVLAVAGRVPGDAAEALARVHDAMAHPRAMVWWTGDPGDAIAAAWPQATLVGPGGDVVAAVVAAHRDLLAGRRASDPAVLPDDDPAPWRGVGPYGQGGSGMTGGVPFGRPMAGRADDLRDGLALDVVPLRIGPFFPLLPPGMVLEVVFAGDVVHGLTVSSVAGGEGVGSPVPGASGAAPGTPVRIADVEAARAGHHLRWLARLLHVYGLDALARRVARAALAGADAADVRALGRRLDRPWVLGRVTRGVGMLAGHDAAVWGGAVARAAGVGADARASSPSYAALGFEPIVHRAGDNRDRWRQRLAEAVQSLELAGRAGTATIDADAIEPPVPPPPADAAQRLASLLVGSEWGDAVATLASIDPAVATGSMVRSPVTA